jgi:hypothetical protein
MIRKKKPASRERAEMIFMTALNRLVQRRIKEGNQVKIDMTSLAEEAGYARSYLYKFPIESVIARLREIQSSDGLPKKPSSTSDVLRKLRDERDQMRKERDIAVETSRRLMLDLMELKGGL